MTTLASIDLNGSPDQLITDMLAYIDAAEAKVQARDALSLAGFDSVVETLCQRINAVKVSEARDYLPRLEEVMTRLNDLQEKMQAYQSEVASTIKSLNGSKKAAQAYNKNQPEGA